MKRSLFNFVAFQAGWFACVLSAADGMLWLGLVVVSLVVILHVQMSEWRTDELVLVFVAVALGLLFDSLLVMSGWLSYSSGILISGIAPYWILAMWALFATTINLSMSWLKGKPLLASVLGAIFGPLSYMAGERLGAMEFVNYQSAIIALALIWALVMPLLVTVAIRLEGSRKPAPLIPLQRLPTGE
jgi:hypothetical protein